MNKSLFTLPLFVGSLLFASCHNDDDDDPPRKDPVEEPAVDSIPQVAPSVVGAWRLLRIIEDDSVSYKGKMFSIDDYSHVWNFSESGSISVIGNYEKDFFHDVKSDLKDYKSYVYAEKSKQILVYFENSKQNPIVYSVSTLSNDELLLEETVVAADKYGVKRNLKIAYVFDRIE